MKEKLTVCWISAGVSSFVAGYLYRDHVDKFLYISIQDQHPDSDRFIADCSRAMNRDIEYIYPYYKNVEQVALANSCLNTPNGAPCTKYLKKRTRKKWEYQHRDFDITYVWGFDVDEKDRAERVVEGMPEFEHVFPLIDHGLSKSDAHGVCAALGIKRPILYDMGYKNNNCLGCLKGGKGYFNKIRKDFPEVFKERAELERKIGRSIIRDKNGMCFLDELDPDAGRMSDEVDIECSIACQILL